jgi:hypothetical protein
MSAAPGPDRFRFPRIADRAGWGDNSQGKELHTE